MPLFTQRESRPAWFDETDQSQWLRPGLGDYLGAAAGDAWEGLPTVALGRLGEMAAMSAQATGTDVELDESGTPVISHERRPMAILPTEEQASIIDAHGLKGQIMPQPGYSRDMLDVVMERKKAELARQATREAAPGIYAPLGFATELGISLFDPINVASAFVPVVGEARVLSMLGRASGALGRAGVRAGVGTVEGAVGAAMIEPVMALAQTQQQADYDMSDALGNIAFGAAFGAALHPAAGAVGDWLRSRRGQRQPWQIMPDTDESLALMRQHRDAIRDARIFAGADETRAAEESAAAAALFDARARRWAYDFNQPVAAFYDRYMPDYRAGMVPFDRTVDNFLSTPESLDQTAYHGTPHRFDDFSLEHIGTGEGAQAHGWGLYFAQDRKVSEDYRNRLRTGRSRGQLFEVDIPENDVLLTDSVENTPRVTGQSGMRQDAAGKISLAIGNREVNGDARARVTFDAAEGGRAVIEFFSAADASSAPHELYHIFRREMAESAARPDAPQRVREDWARIEEFVGAEPGQTWTRAMEEKFARAGERFLLEGKAPTPALQGVFERLRQWFLELYANADAAGLHISPAIREVFGNMLSVPAEQGDMFFRKALGELLSRPVDPVEPAAVPPLPADAPPLETMQAMTVEAEQDLGRALGELEQALPGGAANLRAVYDAEAALIDADIQKSMQVRAVLEEAARCEMRN